MIRNNPPSKTLSAWLLILLPIASMYTIGPIDLDVILMLAFGLFFICSNQYLRITPIGQRGMVLVFYILAITLINIVFGTKYAYTKDIFLRSFKFCVYLALVFLCFSETLTYENVMKVYRIVAYAAAAYIILQTIFFYGAGITLPNRLGDSISDAKTTLGRLRAFYQEPAAMSYALLPFMACSLFNNGQLTTSKKNLTDALVVTLSIFLSTSGQGILVVVILWGIWLFLHIKSARFTPRDLLIFVGVLIIFFILYKTGILSQAIERASNTGEHSTIAARSSGYRTLEILSPLQLLFGTGYGNHIVEDVLATGTLYDTVNYSSLAQFLFSLGIVGTLLWVVFFAVLFRKGNLSVRALILALLVLSIGGCPTLPTTFPIWLVLMGLQLPNDLFAPAKPPVDL